MYNRKELDKVFWNLSDKQRFIIAKFVKHRAINNWLRVTCELSHNSDWLLVDYIDSGGLFQKCTCGQKIRYGYRLMNKFDKGYIVVGGTCLCDYCDITKETSDKLMECMENILLERDYILYTLSKMSFKEWYKSNFDLIDKFIKVKESEEYLDVIVQQRVKRFLNARLPFLQCDQAYILKAYRSLVKEKVYTKELLFLKKAISIDGDNSFVIELYDKIRKGHELSDVELLALRKIMNEGLKKMEQKYITKKDILNRLDSLLDCKLGHTEQFVLDLKDRLMKNGRLTKNQLESLDGIEKRFKRQITYQVLTKSRNILSNLSVTYIDRKEEMDCDKFEGIRKDVMDKLLSKGYDIKTVTSVLDLELHCLEKYFPVRVYNTSEVFDMLDRYFACDKRNKGVITDVYYEIEESEQYSPDYSEFIKGFEISLRGETFYIEIYTEYKMNATRIYILKYDEQDILRVSKSIYCNLVSGKVGTVRIVDEYVSEHFKECFN